MAGNMRQHRARLLEHALGHRAKARPHRAHRVAVEIERQRGIDGVARRIALGIAHAGQGLPFAGQPPRHQPQAADAVRQIMLMEKIRRRRRHRLAPGVEGAQPAAAQMLGQSIMDGLLSGRGKGLPHQCRQRRDHARYLGLRIALPGKTGLTGRTPKGLLAPAGQPLGGGVIEKQRVAEQLLHLLLHLAAQGIDDVAQPRHLARLPGQILQIVADRLFARNGRQGAKQHGEKPRQPTSAAAAAGQMRAWVDIDQPPVHLAHRRFAANRADRFGKGGVYQHRSIDQHRVFGMGARGVDPVGHDSGQKGIAPWPWLTPAILSP